MTSAQTSQVGVKPNVVAETLEGISLSTWPVVWLAGPRRTSAGSAGVV
jgi:hypothetical protein